MIEKHVHHDYRNQADNRKSYHFGWHHICQAIRRSPQGFHPAQALEKFWFFFFQPPKLSLKVFSITSSRQKLELHQLQTRLNIDFKFKPFGVDVAKTIRIGRVCWCQFVDADGFVWDCGLLIVDWIPLAFDHVAHLYFIFSEDYRTHIDWVLLLWF